MFANPYLDFSKKRRHTCYTSSQLLQLFLTINKTVERLHRLLAGGGDYTGGHDDYVKTVSGGEQTAQYKKFGQSKS